MAPIYNNTTGERMNVGKTIRACIEAGAGCRWLPDTGEFRVNFRADSGLGSEATAYYTNDPQDAIGTARLMAQANANGPALMLASERNPEGPAKPCQRCKTLGHNHEPITTRDLATNHERTELYCTPCADALWEALG